MEVFWKILHKFYTDNPCFPILEKYTLNLFSSNIWVFSGKYDDPSPFLCLRNILFLENYRIYYPFKIA